MQLRNFSTGTQRSYIHYVRGLQIIRVRLLWNDG
jgi:hypothetical protein